MCTKFTPRGKGDNRHTTSSIARGELGDGNRTTMKRNTCSVVAEYWQFYVA
jgi:hypothetical protein